MKKERRKEAVEEVLKIMRVTIDVKEIKRLGGNGANEIRSGGAKKRDNEEEKEFERKEGEDTRELDVGGKKNEMEIGGDSKEGGKRKEESKN